MGARYVSFMYKSNVDRNFGRKIKFGRKMLTYKVVWTSENHLNLSDFCAIICNMRANGQNDF